MADPEFPPDNIDRAMAERLAAVLVELLPAGQEDAERFRAVWHIL